MQLEIYNHGRFLGLFRNSIKFYALLSNTKDDERNRGISATFTDDDEKIYKR